MSEHPIDRRRIGGGARLWILFTTLFVGEVGIFSGVFNDVISLLWGPRLREIGGWLLSNFVQWVSGASFLAALLTLFGGGTLATVALAFRYARGAVAGSQRDPVIKVRDFLRQHPRAAAVLPWIPSLLLSPLLLTLLHAHRNHADWRLTEQLAPAAGYLVAAALNVVMNRFALRSLDMLRDREAETATAVSHDETSFQAVAVTARTQGAVIGMTALTIFMVYSVGQSGTFWMRDTAGGLPLVAYALASIGFAAWFRKASTIAVGRDGIFIRGTSKERFYSYQDFDEVRLAGMHFDFHRAGKRVLRLQLHGTDDARAEALAERIRAALAVSRRTDGAHLLARSAVRGSLGRAAQGATDYRQPSVSREQLWDLVEGEATDQQARVAAAEALATSSGSDDRARLRIAAAHVADPRVRVVLEELAEDDDSTAAAPGMSAAKPARTLA